MIREMAERMTNKGSGAAARVSKPTPKGTFGEPVPRDMASPGRRGTVLQASAAFPPLSSSDDDDDDLRDRARARAKSPGRNHLSLQRAQEVQRGQHTPTRQSTGTASVGRPQQGGTAAKAVQAQLRELSANYKVLRQRGAV